MSNTKFVFEDLWATPDVVSFQTISFFLIIFWIYQTYCIHRMLIEVKKRVASFFKIENATNLRKLHNTVRPFSHLLLA